MEDVGKYDGSYLKENVGGNLGCGLNVSAQERRSQRDRTEQEENVLQELENLLVAVK